MANMDNDLLVLLSDAARQMRTYADQVAQTHGLTRAQWVILKRLEQQPDLSQNELAALAEVTAMTVARLVDRLEKLGLLKRCTDPADRRIWRLQLTPAAAPVLRALNVERAKLHNIITKGIDPAVLDAMAVGLRQVKENVVSQRLAKAAA
jgi:MarR family transcriptional regulator, transcriptional regulator for hemolysin